MPVNTFALTFDDGPGARTEEIANWLGDRGIVATFFMNGKNAPGHDRALAAIKARGHVLANHSQNHDDMTKQSGDALYHAVADTDAIIAQYQPSGPWLLRPPYGAWNPNVSSAVNESFSKYVGPVFWDVGGELTATHGADWDCWAHGISVQQCAQLYLNEMRDRGRGIILMHDVHDPSVDMAKIIVETMSSSVKFVPLTTVPSIASALGLDPNPLPNNGDGGDAPATGPDCGTVTYAGFCNKNTLTWCKNNVLTTADCAANGRVCNFIDGPTGSNCVAPTPCGAVDYKGSCDGNLLTWCDGSGALRHNDCTTRGQSCVLVDDNTGYNCQ
jgi:hypothetical protein